ncbi:hypothetical protein AUCHE_16_02150, partial [Austwickia chelonae NBRC 105200]
VDGIARASSAAVTRLETITGVARTSESLSVETSHSAESIRGEADELQAIVGRFRVGM